MIQLLMLLGLMTPKAQIQPCVWPNKCEKAPVLAQIQTCQWPNRCAVSATL